MLLWKLRGSKTPWSVARVVCRRWVPSVRKHTKEVQYECMVGLNVCKCMKCMHGYIRMMNVNARMDAHACIWTVKTRTTGKHEAVLAISILKREGTQNEFWQKSSLYSELLVPRGFQLANLVHNFLKGIHWVLRNWVQNKVWVTWTQRLSASTVCTICVLPVSIISVKVSSANKSSKCVAKKSSKCIPWHACKTGQCTMHPK